MIRKRSITRLALALTLIGGIPSAYSKDRPDQFPKPKALTAKAASATSPRAASEASPEPRKVSPRLTSTSVSLTTSANPVRYGSSVTITAKLNPNTATGIVTFFNGKIPIGSSSISDGIATFSTELLSAGTASLTAHYEGNSTFLASNSPLFPETVADNPSVAFPYYSVINVGTNPAPVPSWVSVGDFNGDGKEDMVSILAGTNQVAVSLGNGDGTFQSPLIAAVGADPYALVIADFNQDGIPDLAVTSDDGIDILLGTGHGQFLPYVPYATPAVGTGTSSFGLAVADFNGDGIPDLVVTDGLALNSGGVGGLVSVFLGAANGTFPNRTDYSVGQLPQAVAVGDFNNDGNSDFAVADILDNTIYVYLGNASGVFTLASGSPVTTGNQPNDITTLYNTSGNLNLVVANATDNQVQIFNGQGNGTFTSAAYINVGDQPDSLVVADFNGDLVPDVAVVNSSDNTVTVLLNTSLDFNGSFLTPQGTYGLCPSCNYVQLAAGDFNNDGVTDIVVADQGQDAPPGGLNVLLGEGCSYSVYPTTVYQDDTSGSTSIVLAGDGSSCSWTASNSNSWFSLSASSGSGSSGSTVVTLQANTTGADRTGTFTLAGQTITVTQRGTAEVFTDVTPNDYFFDAVNLMSAKGVTNGCATGMFCPAEYVTRAQMAVFIVRSIFGGDNFTPPANQIFADVTPSTFGYNWIQELSALGITNGCANPVPPSTLPSFCPAENIPRSQMAIFIIRARFGASTNFTYPQTPYFTDVTPTTFGFEWIQRMKYDNITSGCTATEFCPGNTVTRGDMAVFIMAGEFNDLLPAGTPLITSVSPAVLTAGDTGVFTITGVNTNFVAGQTQLVFGTTSDITFNTINVNSPTSMTVSLTASGAAPQNPVSIYVQTEPQEAVLPNGLTIQ
jgi:hypothetical protein